jgi:hypothetical protein
LSQNAPSVDYPVGRFLWGKRKRVLVAVLAVSALMSYVFGDVLTGWRAGVLLACWLLVFLSSFLAWQQAQTKCWLSWSGDEWRVLSTMPEDAIADSEPCPTPAKLETEFKEGAALTVHLDWQNYLYVSLKGPAQPRTWFWLEMNSFPERWHGFRCAVYSRS